MKFGKLKIMQFDRDKIKVKLDEIRTRFSYNHMMKKYFNSQV